MYRIDIVGTVLVVKVRYMDHKHPGNFYPVYLSFTPRNVDDLIHGDMVAFRIMRGNRKGHHDLAV